MNVSERIKTIIKENSLKQKEFAQSINVTESYISKLLRAESGLSKSTATLIAEKYGYSLNWILNGIEPKKNKLSGDKNLSPTYKKIISDLDQMNEAELKAVKAFINSLKEVQIP